MSFLSNILFLLNKTKYSNLLFLIVEVSSTPISVMKQLSLNEIRIIQLNILKEVDKFCRDNNIVYYLTHGTLLGAAKYKGYIPWDDDADIAMPKPDYDKFISLFNKNQSIYKVKDYSIDKKFPYTYAKIEHIQTLAIESTSIKFEMGINVDLFPLGGAPADQLTLNNYFFNINLYDYLLFIKKAKLSPQFTMFKMLILKILLAPFSYCFILFIC